jgi:hypothetical protein
MNDLAEAARELLESQKRDWPLLRRNCDALRSMQVKTFQFDGFEIQAQHNPRRLASVSAPVDADSIRQRECFLCDRNRPMEQTSLSCGHGFKLLCNPYPILPEHFSIVHEEHRPQRIAGSIRAMLDLAHALSRRYLVFYNGPQCGASAPDHLHFQVGTRGFLPADAEYECVKQRVGSRDYVEIFTAPRNYLRRCYSFESIHPEAIESASTRFFLALRELQPDAPEPMFNLICVHERGRYRLMIFPRTRHRPASFFAEDDSKMLLSPGTLDIAGLVVVPLEDDFRRIGKEHLVQMYTEVSVSAEVADELLHDVVEA